MTRPDNDGPTLFPDTPFPLQPSLELLARRGSESHGTFIPSTDPDSIDDRDLLGVCIPPAPWLFGWRHWEGADAIKGPWDVVLYDYRKFARLLTRQNPNVLGMLWLEPEDYLHIGPAGQALIDARMLFRCRIPAYKSFAGYAGDQLRKMQSGAFQGYMGAKRKALVEKRGYDCKNSAHLVRLLHMGEEYLRTGILQVRRTWDVDQIVSIKRGEWSLENVKAYAADRFVKLKDAVDHSVLPETIDEEEIERIVLTALSAHYKAQS